MDLRPLATTALFAASAVLFGCEGTSTPEEASPVDDTAAPVEDAAPTTQGALPVEDADATFLAASGMHFKIDGMSCGNCVNAIETAVAQINGVNHVIVSLDRKEAVIDADEALVEEIMQTITDSGFTVEKIDA